MQDTSLFMELAGIACVFVGFAALISARSGGASEAHEVIFIRWVVTMGVWVVIAAIALGPFPDQEPAPYLTAVGLVLSLGSLTLLLLVVSQRRLAAASRPAALPATGGLSA